MSIDLNFSASIFRIPESILKKAILNFKIQFIDRVATFFISFNWYVTHFQLLLVVFQPTHFTFHSNHIFLNIPKTIFKSKKIKNTFHLNQFKSKFNSQSIHRSFLFFFSIYFILFYFPNRSQ